MIVFVDYEHADGHNTSYGQRMQAARTWITYRLEDLAGAHCMLVRYDRVTRELLERIGARAVFISGNSIDPWHYDSASVEVLGEVVRTSGLPVFGFCGGFQFLASALAADVVPLPHSAAAIEADERLITLAGGDSGSGSGGAETSEPDGGPESDEGGGSGSKASGGRPFEFGYHSVNFTRSDHPLLEGLGPSEVFRHAHGLHVPEPPPGFDVVATNEVTPVQMAVDDNRCLVGTQFHPEYWTDEHPAGRTLIANFLRWAGI